MNPERAAGGYSPWTTRRNGLFRALPGFMESVAQTGGHPDGRCDKRDRRGGTAYRLAAAWGALMPLIGAGFWVFGTALHNEALAAQQHKRYMDPIYYGATGVEFPAFDACKEMKDQRDI